MVRMFKVHTRTPHQSLLFNMDMGGGMGGMGDTPADHACKVGRTMPLYLSFKLTGILECRSTWYASVLSFR